MRARPDFPAPGDLQANAGPAARDAFKRATDARSAWLACSAAFCTAILDSIGEWLPWRGTAYAVPQYPAVPDFFFAPRGRVKSRGRSTPRWKAEDVSFLPMCRLA